MTVTVRRMTGGDRAAVEALLVANTWPLEDGSRLDCFVYGILRREWAAQAE